MTRRKTLDDYVTLCEDGCGTKGNNRFTIHINIPVGHICELLSLMTEDELGWTLRRKPRKSKRKTARVKKS